MCLRADELFLFLDNPSPVLSTYQGAVHLAECRYCRKYVAKAGVKVFQLGGVVAAKAVVRLVVAAADVGTWAA